MDEITKLKIRTLKKKRIDLILKICAIDNQLIDIDDNTNL